MSTLINFPPAPAQQAVLRLVRGASGPDVPARQGRERPMVDNLIGFGRHRTRRRALSCCCDLSPVPPAA